MKTLTNHHMLQAVSLAVVLGFHWQLPVMPVNRDVPDFLVRDRDGKVVCRLLLNDDRTFAALCSKNSDPLKSIGDWLGFEQAKNGAMR